MTSCTVAIIISILIFVMFALNKLTPGTISLLGTLALTVLIPEVSLKNAYSGFGSNVIPMVAGMSIVSDALFETGIGQRIGASLAKLPFAKNERVFCAFVATVCTVQSAFMSNTGTIIMWMALIATIAAGSNGRIRSKMAIFPAATGAIIGGAQTLIGVSNNAAANAFIQTIPGFESGMGLFDMTVYAWPLAVVQILFWMTIGYNIELKVLKPESPDFDKDNVYAVAPAEAETKADVAAWKGYFAAAVMLGCLVAFVLSGFEPFKQYLDMGNIPMIGTALLFVFKVMPVKKSLANLPWDTLVLVGTINVIGTALTATGAGELLANGLINLLGENATPMVFMIAFVVLGGFLTTFLQNSGTFAFLAPIAVPIAQALGASPFVFCVVLAVTTNMAICTPLGTAVNQLILPAGYKFSDYVKIGGPCWILMMITLCITVKIVGLM